MQGGQFSIIISSKSYIIHCIKKRFKQNMRGFNGDIWRQKQIIFILCFLGETKINFAF
jgi:hypothetical protein